MTTVAAKPLDQRTITELRGIAQASGVAFDFADNRAKLILRISTHMAKEYAPPVHVPVEASDRRFSIKPARHTCTTNEIDVALGEFKPLGLRVTFPTTDSWEIQCGRRKDSGTIFMPLRQIVDAAKRVVA